MTKQPKLAAPTPPTSPVINGLVASAVGEVRHGFDQCRFRVVSLHWLVMTYDIYHLLPARTWL